MIALVKASTTTKPGYRDGVIVVEVPPAGFFTGVVTLCDGDELVGEFKSRRDGEAPRKSIRVNREIIRHDHAGQPSGKVSARLVQVICYSHAVLEEDDDAESDKDWEIVSINGFPTEDEAPIDPTTLMHNHFGSSGGTKTNMTPAEFEAKMRESFAYWKNKALLV